MSGNDYTRWNRSGLTRLQYVDGNAATYLEELREKLYRLCGEDAKWLEPSFDESELGSESIDEEWLRHTINTLLAKQYDERRSGDIGWALMRIFARSCHVLAGHLNAHANETFLRTATEWDDIRKMVSLLGYQPAGATSATTRLVITARAKGTVKKGLQVRHRPITGDKAIVFETLEDIEVDPEFNEFRILGAASNPSTLGELGGKGKSPWRASPKAPVHQGDSALVLHTEAADVVAAAQVSVGGDQVLTLVPQVAPNEEAPWKEWKAGEARLRTSPRFKRAPWINGTTVRRSRVPHGLSPGSVIAWRKRGEADPKSWRFVEVERADAFGIELREHAANFAKLNDKGENIWANDDDWPPYDDPESSDVEIEVRRAVRLVGSFTVPAKTDAEKIVGQLSDFTAGKLFQVPKGFESDLVPLPKLDVSGASMENADATLSSFLKWLFGELGGSLGFPLSPAKLVEIGAMILTQSVRIPSTGQLMFEAFLDLFGGGGADQTWVTTGTNKSPLPALFRFWVDPNAPQSDKAGHPDFGKATGELWYLPVKVDGAGKLAVEPADTLTFFNVADNNRFFFDGKPNGIHAGDWVAAKFRSNDGVTGQWHALKVVDLEEPPKEYARRHSPSFALQFGGAVPDGEMTMLHGDYRHEGRPEEATVNGEPAGELELRPTPKNEQPLLAWNGTAVSRVTAITENGKTKLVPALSDEYTLGNLKLFGNVVQAGHGERQPPERMGAGTGQDRPDFLILEQREVSTVPDSVIARGAREDIVVRIQGEEWHARTQLDESGPTDRHYVMSTTEMGFLKLQFGDGHHGRALPPGTNNVTIEYRSGAGARGCVAAGSLDRLVHPHPLIESVRQPLAATGGSDMERREDMRERASASVLAMERAVSVSDFEQLAMQHRSVAKARAFYTIGGGPGRTDLVDVVAVLAGGAQIDGTTTDSLARYLQHRAIPTISVRVSPHEDCKVTVRIAIRVDPSRYVPDSVRNDVIAAVATAFSIDRRQIGEPLHLSELYAVVEAVAGVEDCECSFSKASGATQVPSGPRQICHISADAIDCPAPTEYEP